MRIGGGGGIVGKNQGADTTYDKQNVKNLRDSTCPLHEESDCRQIERSGEYRTLKIRTARHSNSFLPKSITLFNDNIKREDWTRRVGKLLLYLQKTECNISFIFHIYIYI